MLYDHWHPLSVAPRAIFCLDEDRAYIVVLVAFCGVRGVTCSRGFGILEMMNRDLINTYDVRCAGCTIVYNALLVGSAEWFTVHHVALLWCRGLLD
jgi:hypothetical protein